MMPEDRAKVIELISEIESEENWSYYHENYDGETNPLDLNYIEVPDDYPGHDIYLNVNKLLSEYIHSV